MTLRLETISVESKDVRESSSTSKGNQKKWNRGSFWLKQNYLGYEDKAEYIVSKVLEHSDLKTPYTEYKLCNIYDTTVGSSFEGCYSLDFLKEQESLVTFYRILEKYDRDLVKYKWGSLEPVTRHTYLLQIIKDSTGVDIEQYLKETLTLDMLVLNEDRHLNNLAVIMGSDGENRLAPIFDNGLSLLSDTRAYPHFNGMETVDRVRAKTLSPVFSRALAEVGGGFQVDGHSLLQELEPHKKELGRALDVLKFQLDRYKGTIVK